MTAYTDVCGEVDPLSGAVCTSEPHEGKTHTDRSVPECMIQWGPAPGLRHVDESLLCWARSDSRQGDAWPVGCDKRVYVGGLCATHAHAYGVVA